LGLIQSLFGSGRDPEYGRESVTLTGVKVKSYAEKQIADYFTRNGIEYQYERVARSQRLFSVKKIARPDFYLPAFKVFVEYWGLVDADSNRTRSEYTGLMRYKMAQYHRHKIRFVSLYPSDLGRLDQAFRRKLLETTGKELPVPG
jgi:hypothetical protein